MCKKQAIAAFLFWGISENEVRKDFSKAERIDYARRLERIESAKAEERQKSGANLGENFPKGRTTDIVAQKMGIGSGKQYEKEKTIVDNKELLDPSESKREFLLPSFLGACIILIMMLRR